MRLRILELLEENSRLDAAQVATMLGMEAREVKAEIEAMEEEGIILNYAALINWEKAGVDKVSAVIEVKITPQKEVGFDEIAKKIYRYQEVKTVTLMSGNYDLLVQVEGKTLKEVARFVAKKLATIDYVQSTVTHFVLKQYKQAGVIFENEEDDRRQVISP